MKTYPYSKLKSDNLGILLFSARALATLGITVLISGVLTAVLGTSYGGTQIFGNGITMTTSLMTSVGFIGLIRGIFLGIVLLAFSGICAAIVSFEYKYTASKG